VRDQIPQAMPIKVAEFINPHLLMLEDAALVDPARALIRERLFSAEWALEYHRMGLVQAFEGMGDSYLRSRRDDVDHVVQHILGFLLSGRISDPKEDANLNGCVVIAHDVSPADTVILRQRRVVALVTEYGGPLSHTAILARSLNLPTVVGVRNVTGYFRQGETVVVDDEAGVVSADADADILAYYQQRMRVLDERQACLRHLIKEPSLSADRTPVSLLGNLDFPEATVAIRTNRAVGVGLYRTEFLLSAYLEVMRGLEGAPVTIRTLDLGADEQVDGNSATCPPGCNPAQGLRAIRLCLKEPGLFRPQLRAILRASAFGPVHLMIPMLSHIRELDSTLALIEQAGRELEREGVAFDPRMPVGGIIEVLATALSATAFVRPPAGWIFSPSAPTISSSTLWPLTARTVPSAIFMTPRTPRYSASPA